MTQPNMTIEFTVDSNAFIATGYYLPGRPAQLYGPPESCYPEEPPEFEFYTLKVETSPGRWVDAMWALDSVLTDHLMVAALEAIEADSVDNWFGGYDDYAEWGNYDDYADER